MAAAEVQALLRFLTKDGRLPLVEAMPKITSLRKLDLGTPEKIAQASNADLKAVFTDEKILKQIVNAAKRVSNPKKKASAPNRSAPKNQEQSTTVTDEESLALPEAGYSEEDLLTITIETNRAPLFLAFTILVLGYTYPEQPISSRLSLAQTVVSTSAQSRAKFLGITSGPTAEEDGWAQGQPKIKVMGREIAVMRRQMSGIAIGDSQQTVDHEAEQHAESSHEAFWGIDLEALRKSNGPLIVGSHVRDQKGPPIHTPQAARSYLLKSIDMAKSQDAKPEPAKSKKSLAQEISARKEQATAALLKAIDIVLDSWKDILTSDELDRRAQTWYTMVRPEVAPGQAGWGQRGHLRLKDVLDLKRRP
jgi:hypothetical protein